jgi:hypothetical protein
MDALSEPIQNAIIMVFILALFALTGAIVWVIARLLRWRREHLSFPLSLVISHTILLSVCVALCPTGIFFADRPFDELYLGYYLFPGVHLYFLASMIIRPLEPLFLRMPEFLGAVMYLLIVPGLICGVLGGGQWYLIGKLVEWIRARHAPRIHSACNIA